MTSQFFTERNNLGMFIATKWRHDQFFQFPVHLVRCSGLGNLQLNILLQLLQIHARQRTNFKGQKAVAADSIGIIAALYLLI